MKGFKVSFSPKGMAKIIETNQPLNAARKFAKLTNLEVIGYGKDGNNEYYQAVNYNREKADVFNPNRIYVRRIY